jgi:hypothetical protein
MSFTSRELRGWFHTFTSLPLVHTPNPDFWGNVFDLASFWFSNPLSMTPEFRGSERMISHVRDSRVSPILDSRLPRLHDSRLPRFPDSDFRDFLIPGFRDFMIPDFRNFLILNFCKNRASWNKSKAQIQGPTSAIIFHVSSKTCATSETR